LLRVRLSDGDRGREVDLRIRLLGRTQIRIGDTFRGVGAPQQGLLLAALAWDAGRAVSVDTLIDRIWDEPPLSVQSTFSGLVSRLRALLRGDGAGALVLDGSNRTYHLSVEPQHVDSWHFRRLHAEARACAEQGADERALAALDEAAELWRGEPLAGLPGGWPAEVRADLDACRAAGELLRATLDVRRGRYFEAITRLRRAHAFDPTHEAVAEQFALALYGDGRPHEATRVIQEFSTRLRREAGSDIGAGLRLIQDGILHRRDIAELLPGRPGAAGLPRRAAPAPSPLVGPPENLPPDTPWVGRQEEVTALLALLEREPDPAAPPVCPLSSIDGMAGIGKTALAVHVGHRLRERYPDAQLMTDLRGFSPGAEPLSPAEALKALLRAAGLPPEQLPSGTEQLAQLWRDVMRERRAVVILDNARDIAQIRPLLLPRFRGVTLVTSRNRLAGLPGMVSLSLGALSEDEAVALFERRVAAARRPAREATARIVRLCGRLPLAVDLVASRFASRPAWSAADLLDRLARPERRLAELRSPDGQRVGQAFDLSYRSLDARRRQVFRRVGAHPGTEFGVHAAAALSGLSVLEAEDALEELLGCHLVDEPTPNRYRMHDLLRSYAAEVMIAEEPPGARERAHDRLFRHYLAAADAADRETYSYRVRTSVPEPESDLPRCARKTYPEYQRWWLREGSGLLALLKHARAHQSAERAALYAHVLAGFLEAEGHVGAGLPALRRAAAHWRVTGPSRAEVVSLLDLGSVYVREGDWPAAIATLERALALSRGLRDEECEAEALMLLAIPFFRLGDLDRSMIYLRKSLSLATARGDRLKQGKCTNVMAATLLKMERYPEALDSFRQALEHFTELGDESGRGRVLHNIGICFRDMGEYREAEAYQRRALRISDELGDRMEFAVQTANLTQTINRTGQHHEALRRLDSVLPQLRSLGDAIALSTALNSYGTALRGLGSAGEAVPYHRAALEAARGVGVRSKEVQALRALGHAEVVSGRRATGIGHIQESLQLARDAGARAEVRESLRTLADLGAEQQVFLEGTGHD
jgi:tetratricopeptide (TPR) repeat protein